MLDVAGGEVGGAEGEVAVEINPEGSEVDGGIEGCTVGDTAGESVIGAGEGGWVMKSPVAMG